MSGPARTGLVLTALAGLTFAGLATTQLGAAAGLDMRVAAPLQVIEKPVDVDASEPAPPEHTITVVVRRFSGGQHPREVGNSPVRAQFPVPTGHTYAVAWSEGPTVACSDLEYTIPEGHLGTIEGEFTAMADVTHEVCTQTGNGTVSVDSWVPEAS